MATLPDDTRSGEAVSKVIELARIFVSIAVNVISHYICKWLDGHKHR